MSKQSKWPEGVTVEELDKIIVDRNKEISELKGELSFYKDTLEDTDDSKLIINVLGSYSNSTEIRNCKGESILTLLSDNGLHVSKLNLTLDADKPVKLYFDCYVDSTMCEIGINDVELKLNSLIRKRSE